jgi:spermidine/putrescine transport system substrate-binding protein
MQATIRYGRWLWVLGLSLVLAGCGGRVSSTLPGPKTGTQELKVLNWSEYIDKSLIPEFEKKTGCKVVYELFASDDELTTKLLTGDSGYDVVFPSDKGMAPLIQKDLLREIDKSKLSNWKHLDAKFLNPPYDPGNRFGVPYFWGTAAIGIRTDKVTQPVKGFEVLFDEKFKGRITMLKSPEDVVAIALLHLGLPMNSTKDEDLAKVKELLIKQKPLVQSYTDDSVKEKLIKGEAWVCLFWSGDILQAREESEDKNIQAIVPASGSMIWVDSMAILKKSKNPALAYEFINFLLDPEIAARNANYVKYPSPNKTAREKVDPKLLKDPAIYPPQEVLDKCQWLQDKGPAVEKIEALWKEVTQ